MFAFVGSQYRLEVDGREFFIDILFAKIKAGHLICAPLSMLSLPPQLSLSIVGNLR